MFILRCLYSNRRYKESLFRHLIWMIIFPILFVLNSCISQFIPSEGISADLLVVEGLITDQPGQNIIKLSVSMPLGGRSIARPLSGGNVTVSDDMGNDYNLSETIEGTYVPDASFRGFVGRTYTLHVISGPTRNNINYISTRVLLKQVPPIDTVYYEKVVLGRAADGYSSDKGCQIYLATHDPVSQCKFYRWEYEETWEFSLPYIVPNNHCWTTEYSTNINIKNTSSLSEDKIVKFPLNFVTNKTDRLKEKYSILVKQYSLNEEEYGYLEKLQNTIEQVGSLYDMTPESIPSNILCIDRPEEKVLGYFSVSSIKSKRIFIKDQFRGIVNLYNDCSNAVIGPVEEPVPVNLTLGVNAWVSIDHREPPPPYRIITFFKQCADCTARGTTVEPDFWKDSK
jgi:hypothetical protein